MNAEDQKILERIEFNKGNLPVPDAKWLISQLKAAQEENERLRNQWQPIETAPKHGPWILAICTGFIPSVVQWSETHRTWMDTTEMDQGEPDGFYHPTHWQPLPQPPTT